MCVLPAARAVGVCCHMLWAQSSALVLAAVYLQELWLQKPEQ